MDTQDKYQFDKEKHVHTLNGTPLIGTTSAMDILQPPLTWWASGLACEYLGWFNDNKSSKNYIPQEVGFPILQKRFEEIKKLTPKEYQKELNKAYRKHSERLKDAGEKGTSTHELVEQYIKSELTNTLYVLPLDIPEFQKRQLNEFIEWAERSVKKFMWSEVCTYSKVHWLGGISDFGYIDMEDRLMIGDVKTSKDIYPNYFLQEAAYDIQLTESGGYSHTGEKILVLEREISGYTIVVLPREGTIKVGHNYNRPANQKGYLACLYLHKHLNQ